MPETPEGDSEKRFEPDPSWPEPGLYEHYRGGCYTLLLVALLKEDESPQVVYVASQPVRSYLGGSPWVCPLSEWIEEVEWPDGSRGPRFKHTDIE